MAEDPYAFLERFSRELTPEDTVVCDAGSAFYMCHQALRLPDGCRLITDLSQAAMGAAVPMAIGARKAKSSGEVYAITGDGSAYFQLPALMQASDMEGITVYVLGNGGYKSIADSQNRHCEGRRMGDPYISEDILADYAFIVRCDEYEIRKPTTK